MDCPSQQRPKCFFILFDLIGVQQRHLCIGIIICCLSAGIIIAENQQPSPFYTGYWMGSLDLFTALFIFLCAMKPIKIILGISAMLDAAATVVTFAGSVQLLSLRHIYTTGWVGIATCVFLLYHCASCIYDADACCAFKPANSIDPTFSTEPNSAERQAEEGAGREPREERRRRRRSLSPPSDFRMPDELPQLPEYKDLGNSEGLPPDYDTLSTAPPAYSPSESEDEAHM